jgi:ketosteroid isomerase-like protein
MRLLTRLTMIATLAVSLFSGAVFAQPAAGTGTQVERVTRQWIAAYAGGPATLDKYFSYYADDLTILIAPGRWTKAEYYKFWKQVNADGGGTAAAAVNDLRVQVSATGDAAAVTFQMPVTRRGSLAAGLDREVVWNMAAVWFKQPDGRWLIKSIAYFPVAPWAAPSTADSLPAGAASKP